jgi:predicted O-methyltransferase YrrM
LPSDPDFSFFSYTTHPYLRRLFRTYPRVRHDLQGAFGVEMDLLLKGSGRRADGPREVRLREGPPFRALGWRDLEFLVQSLCTIRAVFGRPDPALLRRLWEERQAIDRSLRERFEMEKRPKGAAGGGVGTKEVVLHCLVLQYRPSLIVETGVAHGISSRFILRALEAIGAGKLVSIDLPPYQQGGYDYRDGTHDPTFVPQEFGVGWLVPDDLRARWDLRLGKSSDILPKLAGPVDLFFHDSEHSYETMMLEFRWAGEHLVPGGFLVSDDASWNESFHDFVRPRGAEYHTLGDGYIAVARRAGAAQSS